MYIEYNDILTRIADEPLWWLDGVPRFEPFRPHDVGVYSRQVALVHTECQGCRTRYDVAVQPRGYGRDLRNLVAYQNSFEVGDPPNACNTGLRCAGATMGSIELAVLEFWERDDPLRGWQRDPTMERPLVDADWDEPGKHALSEPVFFRIHRSDQANDWIRALQEQDFDQMVTLLEAFECDRAAEVAYMLVADLRHAVLVTDLDAFRRERLGKA